MKELIRNFSIIAHIDHGKSTLADRFLEKAHLIDRKNKDVDQVLDDMELERERGITIKANTVRLEYKYNNQIYILNLIDTPGHVDFSYEVSRSLASCEGAVLLVDASQGVEAQSIANFYIAMENDLEIIPVINKIDLPNIELEKIEQEIENAFGFTKDEVLKVSAKTGQGVDELLAAIIEKIPAPKGDPNSPLKALIFDSYYDSYVGTVTKVRLFDGKLKKGDKAFFFSSKKEFEVMDVGVFKLKKSPVKELSAGEVGYIIGGIKDIEDARVGDTISLVKNPASEALQGYKEPKPMVFSGLYPTNSDNYEELHKALQKLKLNDASFAFEPETSSALGFGFRCGYLGLLHMEIIQERIEREFNINIITTAPNVRYRITVNGITKEVDNPADFPDNQKIEKVEEPYIKANIYTPSEYIGGIMKLLNEKRGEHINLNYITQNRVQIIYNIPFSEIVFDFYDKLKTVTRGYASFDYEHIGYREGDLVKLNILIHGEPVDALSIIVHRDKANYYGREVLLKLKKLIPRQLFQIALQAAIGNKIIARENISALRKNVTAKCYGGDITRKRKLLEKQKEGKKRMKQIGRVEVPQEAFFAILNVTK